MHVATQVQRADDRVNAMALVRLYMKSYVVLCTINYLLALMFPQFHSHILQFFGIDSLRLPSTTVVENYYVENGRNDAASRFAHTSIGFFVITLLYSIPLTIQLMFWCFRKKRAVTFEIRDRIKDVTISIVATGAFSLLYFSGGLSWLGVIRSKSDVFVREIYWSDIIYLIDFLSNIALLSFYGVAIYLLFVAINIVCLPNKNKVN